MLEKGQNWELFGYDMRQLGKHWFAAWYDLLWVEDSPLRQQLDGVVQLRSEDGIALYQAGSVVASAPVESEAVLLPDELVLTRVLSLPASVEADLADVLALEVNANSPFAPDDTGFGWKLLARSDSQLRVALVIVSMSAVMSYLGKQLDKHDPRAQEVWAQVDDGMVLLRGFGEASREDNYRKRLLRCAAMVAACAVLLATILGVAAVSKRAELSQLETLSETVQEAASVPSRLRASLVLANETITALNDVVAKYPNPHREIARLTELLGDDVSIAQFTMDGLEIRVRGRARDAAAVMQKLTDEPSYAEVAAPQAITKVGNTDLEQFSLNITLRGEVSG
jgi:general secretion pathway protein L